MKLLPTLALALLAACASSGRSVRESSRPRPDLVPIARSMTAIDGADRRGGDDILAERQKWSAAADKQQTSVAAKFLAVYAQPHGEDRWGGFKQLSQEFPEAALGQLGMASVYVEWKVLDQADRAIAEALDLEPDNWLAVRCRAEVAERRERLDFAAEDYRTVLSADPKNPECHLGLARIARAKGDKAAAKREAEAALETAADLAGALDLLAGLALESGDTGTAIARYSQAVRSSPNDRAARMTLAKLQRKAGDAAGARDQYRAAVDLKQDAEALAALAEAANAAGDQRTEIEAIERLSGLDPSAAEWLRVAEIRLGAKDLDGAEKAYRRALARDARDAQANAGLGRIFVQRGQSQEAVEFLRAGGDVSKDDLAALERRLNLDRVSRPDVGQLQKAIQALVDRTYRTRLAQTPTLQGELKVRVTVAAAGGATLVEVLEDSIHDADVRACAYWNLRDAAYPQNKPGRFTFGFAFRR